MFEEGEPFNGFTEGCQADSVPSLLLALVSMVLEGPSINDQMADTTPAALAITQMQKCNCIKDNRAHPTTGIVTARHSAAQETPVPTYVGMMLHAHTSKRELVDRVSHLGMSTSYTRAIELSAQVGNSACQQFHREHVVCSPKMRSNVFTKSAIDNIDHNASSTTAKRSFHGTAISLLQQCTPLSLANEWTEALQSLVDIERQPRKWSAACHTTILMSPSHNQHEKHFCSSY